MKRTKVFAILITIILSGLSTICLAQYGRGTLPAQVNREGLRSVVSQLRTIQLSQPDLTGQLSVEAALAKRRSIRQFTQQQLGFSEIGQLAWAGQGITEQQRGFRTAPSAGALYPITLYISIDEGLFVYHPEEHILEQVLKGDTRDRLAAAAFNQSAVASAACDIIVVGSVQKLVAKYQNQARKYMTLEAGHVAQNILLQAVSLDLGAVPIGAFNIDGVRKLCGLRRGMEPLYIICVGHPAGQQEKEKQTQKKRKQQSQESRRDASGLESAVLIVPSMNFLDTELLETQKALTNAGVHSVIASTRTGVIMGASGRRIHSELLITNIALEDFDAIIFIGGAGINEYLFNPLVGRIINEAISRGKVIGAISNAPDILANAGILNGYKVTALPSEQIFLERAGAQYTGAYVEEDGQIITASGSQVAGQFGRTIARAILE